MSGGGFRPVAEALTERAELARLVGLKTDFDALPQVAQDALYGLAALLEDAAAALAARPVGAEAIEKARRAIGALRSAMLSGEPYSERLAAAVDEALAALDVEL